MTTETQERLQKVMARAGLGSRRQVEDWIRAGRVQVNGQPAELGQKVGEGDSLTIDGKPVSVRASTAARDRPRVLVYHKPVGEVTTRSDPEGRATVFDQIPDLKTGRWITIGRLDLNTSGLLLFTTHGDLAHRLMHPSSEIEREYAVRVLGEVSPQMLKALTEGVDLEDGKAHFDSIVDAGGSGANHWYHVVLREGRNREVRRLWESQGLKISRLQRVRYGPIELPRRVSPGKWEELDAQGIALLFAAAGLPKPDLTPPRRHTRNPTPRHKRRQG
ncbi:MAG: pseudouridine synthase [Gammaproteobacteria bacterium]|nr:pseudouridine synthase [Gammaproteobacteria bacterium]